MASPEKNRALTWRNEATVIQVPPLFYVCTNVPAYKVGAMWDSSG